MGQLTGVQQLEALQRDRSSSTVLVVDDERATRLYAQQTLAKDGFNVIEAKSGEQALELLQKGRIDAVLLDINMPGMGGYEACREIRRQISDPFLPVVVITGLDDRDSIEFAYKVGATDFSVKPVDWQILKQRLKYLIRTKELSHTLRQSEQQKRELVDAIPDTILRVDGEGVLKRIKPGVRGAQPIIEQLSDIHLAGQLPSLLRKEIVPRIPQALTDGQVHQFKFTLWCGLDDFCYEARMFSTGDNEVAVMLRNITEAHRDEEQMRHYALHDRLTDLPNLASVQQYLHHLIEKSVEGQGQVGVFRLDIVGLEYTNSVLGNEAGDTLIRLWSSRLEVTSKFLCKDVCDLIPPYVARVGGPAFVVVVQGIETEALLSDYALIMEQRMTEPFLIGEYEMHVTTRIGAALSAEDDSDGYSLLKRAELALTEARKDGRRGLNLYSAETHMRTVGRISLAHDLRRAIDKKELHIEYQPKVCAFTSKLVGLEALVRWLHPEQGMLSPSVFIPLAEESDLILGLGEYVLEECCRQLQAWSAAGYTTVPVAVNFSGQQFNQRSLVDGVTSMLQRYDVDPSKLEIEITESVAIDNGEQLQKVLEEFKVNGIHTSMDDFGTGYSSLSSLRQFPFTTIKIDKSFIQHVMTDDNAAAIAEAIINMGHSLKLQVVAEGVEEEGQLAFLRQKGCDVIQGYLTGRPMRAENLTEKFLAYYSQ